MNEASRNKQIAEQLKRARKEAGLSAAQVAKHLKFSTVSLFRMEDGQSAMSVERLETLAKLYGITPSSLLDGRFVRMPTSIDLDRMKAVVTLIQSVIASLDARPSPEKVGEVTAMIYQAEIDRLLSETDGSMDFDPDHHRKTVELIFRS
ncbi:MAG: helix-turn-helix domain-containing protein [Pseudomonadota bacterium]